MQILINPNEETQHAQRYTHTSTERSKQQYVRVELDNQGFAGGNC